MTDPQETPDVVQVLLDHKSGEFLNGTLRCTCGAVVWDRINGFFIGPVPLVPFESVGSIAQAYHIADVLSGIENRA